MTTRAMLVACLAVMVFAMPAGAQMRPARREAPRRVPSEPVPFLGSTPSVEASCVIRIDFDPATLPLSQQLAYALIRSAPIAGRAAKETSCEGLDYSLNLEPLAGLEGSGPSRYSTQPPRRAPASVRRPFAPGTGLAAPGTFIANLTARASQDKGATKAKLESFLAAVCSRLEKALIQAVTASGAQMEGRLKQLADELTQAQKRLEVLKDEQRALSAKAGGGELSRKSVLRRIAQLESDRRSLEDKAAVRAARLRATQEQIAKSGREAADKLKDDPIAAELAKIIKVRESQLRLTVAARKEGRASEAEVGEAEAELAEARVELAKRREEVSRAVGAEMLKELNQELVHLSISTAERKAQLELLTNALLDLKTTDLLRLADKFEQLEREIRLAEKLYWDLAESRRRLARQLRDLRMPAVTVIGGKPGAAKTQPKPPVRR